MNATDVGPPTAAELARIIEAHPLRWTCEADLQAGIAGALASRGIHAEREVRLSDRDRVDFLVGRVAVEVKMAREPAADVLGQLSRYGASDRVDQLLLVTTRAMHCRLPCAAGGKMLHVLLLRGIG